MEYANTKIQNTNVLSPVQAGFRKDHRTSDHILTVKKDKYLYTCFVDFHKAYNSIQRDGLKDKLKQSSINGRKRKPSLSATQRHIVKHDL